MGLIAWVVVGLLAGFLAKWILPGKDPGGILVTILIGIAGGIVGGYLSSLLGMGGINGFTIKSILISTLGAVLLLYLYKRLRK